MDSKKIKSISIGVIFSVCAFWAFGLVASVKETASAKADAKYCEMVEIYKRSNGTFGWAEFKDPTEANCPVTGR